MVNPSRHRPGGTSRRSRLRLLMLATGVVALAAASGLALAQGGGAAGSADAERRTLVVTGRSTVTVPPDTVRITVGVESQAPTARQAHEATSRKVEDVVSALLSLGIPSRNLQTAGMALAPVYRYDERSRENLLVGYRSSYTLHVLVEQIDQAGAVVDAAVQAGANRVESIQFLVRDLAAVKHRAIAQAVADAMGQARVLAQAAGVQLGPLLSVRDLSFVAPGPPVRVPLARLAEPAAETPVLPGEMEFSASATFTFAIR